MPRVKPNLVPAYPIHSLEDVDSGLARIAALKRQIDLINLSAAERMDEIKTGAAAEIEPIKQEIGGIELSIGRFAEAGKEELFSKKKSLRSPSASLDSGLRPSSSRKPSGHSSACFLP